MKNDQAEAAPDVLDDEAGMALLLVVGIGVVLLLLGAIATSMAQGSLTSSTGHVTYERNLHLAEEGIDQTLARLQATKGTYATTPAVTVPTFAAPGAAEAEEAWARAQLATAATTQTDRGEFAVVKPTNRNVVYSAAWVPNRANAKRDRLLKVEYIFSTYAVDAAVLIGNDLIVQGNAKVLGGDVHANGDLTENGASWQAQSGDVTSSGTFSGSPTVCTAPNTPSGCQVASYDGDVPPRFIPPIRPESVWQKFVGPGATSTTFEGDWYDLCYDDGTGAGYIRRPDAGGPCQGSLNTAAGVGGKLTNSGATSSFRGWSVKKTGSKVTWEFTGSTPYDGVYYVHRATANVGSNVGTVAAPWRATILTEGAAGSSCTLPFPRPVDIEITGSPKMAAFVEGLQLISGGDISFTGGGSVRKFKGLLGAHEQVSFNGTVDLLGTIIAEDACDTTGSAVTDPATNLISGDMTLTYDSSLDLELDPYIRTTLWLEY